MGLVRSFQISAVFPNLTVLENVRIALQRTRGHSFDFWRSARALARHDDRALRADRRGRAHRVRGHAGGRARLRPQARARNRDDARARSGDDAAGRADRRHDARGRRADRGADPQGRGEPHRADGRAQPGRRVDAVRPHHGARARRGPGRGRLRARVEASGRGPGLSWEWSMPDERACGVARGAPARGARAAARGARSQRVVRRIARAARRDLRRRGRRGGDAARPQRRRQDDDAEVDHGHRAAARGLDRVRRARDRRACRRTGSPGSGIAYCPEERGIFASLNVEENLLLPPVGARRRAFASSRSSSCSRT